MPPRACDTNERNGAHRHTCRHAYACSCRHQMACLCFGPSQKLHLHTILLSNACMQPQHRQRYIEMFGHSAAHAHAPSALRKSTQMHPQVYQFKVPSVDTLHQIKQEQSQVFLLQPSQSAPVRMAFSNCAFSRLAPSKLAE